MKRSIIPFAAAALILFGCQEKPEPVPEPEAKLEVSPASISFDSSASEKTITITATQDWKAAVEGEGFSISSSAGKGNAEVKVSAGANESLDARKGKVTITSGKLSVKVELSQAGEKPVILIEGDSVEVPAEGGRYEINVKYNTEYSFEIDQSAQDWLHCVGTRALQEGKIDFVVDENESADERTAKVTISGKKASDLVSTITFTQAGSTKDSVLPGEFSVGWNKKVQFSRGNLYWDGSRFNFEDAQWKTFPATEGIRDASHVRHFFWSKSSEISCSDEFNESDTASSDVFFTNATVETANPGFTVNGETGKYRTLSIDEWNYLLITHKTKWVAVNGVNGYIIAPDNFTGTVEDSYADDAALAADNLVFLPAAGGMDSNLVVFTVGINGYYWSSSAYENFNAYYLWFTETVNSYPNTFHDMGFSVRLVTDIN